MIFNKNSRTVKSMLIMMKANKETIEDVDSFIPDQNNLREVVKQCLEEQKASSND